MIASLCCLNPSTPRVALGFECQVIAQVPVDKHDAKMTMLITENEVYKFENSKGLSKFKKGNSVGGIYLCTECEEFSGP